MSTTKETFQWNTPADEFAQDVGSDDEGEKKAVGPVGKREVAEDEEMSQHYNEDDDDNDPLRDGLDHEHDEDEGGQQGIIINLGVDEADKFAVVTGGPGDKKSKIERYISENMDSSPGDAAAMLKKKKGTGEPKQKFPCPKCPKIWNWPWELRRHIMTHFKEKERQETSAYKCEECGKGFQWKRDLAQHKRLHTGEKLLVCSVCEKKFTTRQALLHHVVVHTGEKPFQCAICGNRFTQPANLRTHMKKKHNDASIKGNKCPHCGEAFQSIISVHQHILEDHQNIVAEEREVLALERIKKEEEKMSKEIAKTENRKRRLERASGLGKPGKRFKEWEMEYEFQLGEGLVKGVDWDRTPSNGELSCDQCERKFGWRYEVMFHGLCHLIDEDGRAKNKVCPECDTAFKVPIGLKHHLLIHTGELPFLCLHCWKSFSSHIDLKLHIRKEHLVHLNPVTEDAQESELSAMESDKTAFVKKQIKRESEKIIKKEIKKQTIQQYANNSDVTTVVVQDPNEAGAQGGDQTQTIVLSGEGIQSNEDMIVIVQSGDFDQSQGLIVVDPSQIQHMSNGQMIVSDQSNQYINLMGGNEESGEQTTVVVTQDGQDNNSYVVVQEGADGQHYQIQQQEEQPGAVLSNNAEETKIILQQQRNQAEANESAVASITAEPSESNEELMNSIDEATEAQQSSEIEDKKVLIHQQAQNGSVAASSK